MGMLKYILIMNTALDLEYVDQDLDQLFYKILFLSINFKSQFILDTSLTSTHRKSSWKPSYYSRAIITTHI
jgi:hypothetical protein